MAFIGNDLSTIVKQGKTAYKFVCTEGQTEFSGSDSNGLTLKCTADTFVNVYLNGVRLIKGDDFTLGTDSLTLLVGGTLADELMIVADVESATFNTYTKTEVEQKIVELSPPTDISGKADINNPEFTGEYIKIPVGTSAERPTTGSTGMLRFNTDFGRLEQFIDGGWASIDTPPTITNLSYSGSLLAADPAGGETITLTGENLQAGLIITIGGVTAPSVTYIDGTTVQFTTPAMVAGDYDVKLTNANGLSAILQNGISYNGTPVFSTSAGKIGNDLAPSSDVGTITIVASEPDGGTLGYSITSGGLPTGLSMDSSGNITGSTNEPTGTTTYNFTVTATDDENQTNSRAFNLVVLRPVYAKKINKSIKFNQDDVSYLERTPSIAGNQTTWTWSGWVKRSVQTTEADTVFCAANSSSDRVWLSIRAINTTDPSAINLVLQNGATQRIFRTNPKFRDPSDWYHLVVAVDTTQATETERVKIYLNGEQLTNFSSAVYPVQNETFAACGTSLHRINSIQWQNDFNGDMLLAENHFVDGLALPPTSFAEDYNGTWTPKTYSGSYGTTGYYLDFDGIFYNDKSGNGNNFSAVNLNDSDIIIDTPTNNFAVLNRYHFETAGVFTNSNLRADSTNNTFANVAMKSGKWYYEHYIETGTPSGAVNHIGVVVQSVNAPTTGWDSGLFIFWRADGVKYYNGVSTSGHTTYQAGDIMSAMIDFDNELVTFWKNGSPDADYENLAFPSQFYNADGSVKDLTFMTRPNPSDNITISNFGQDSSFNGNLTRQNNTDSNGEGDFYYAPPTGFLALCTRNFQEPGTNVVFNNNVEKNFNVALWTGNGAASQQVQLGFNPDFMIVKDISAGRHWRVFDSVRGFNNSLFLNRSEVENHFTDYGYVLSTDSTSFTVGQGTHSNNLINENGTRYAAWCWNAGDNIVTNTDGSITSSVKANTDAGFSIVNYTGAGNDSTIGHGLDNKLDFIMIKARTSARDWAIYHKDLSIDQVLSINLTNAAYTEVNFFREDLMSSSVFGVNGDYNTGFAGYDYTAYCWHEVPGFSKFGTYEGNSSSNGPFVYTGFKPAFILIKGIDSATDGWELFDSTRNANNPSEYYIRPYLPDAEFMSTTYPAMDFLSNGFKFTSIGGYLNDPRTYVYIAFAEDPFKYSTAR
jgi:hypothetical protein